MAFETVDLNLFALFDAMTRTRSASASARELGVTPSAVSHGLSRLRRLLGDELFVPSPRGMQLTARAQAFAPRVSQALGQIDAILGERPFHPRTEARLFTVGATDYTAGLIVPDLARRLLERMPGSQLRVLPHGRLDMVQLLDEGQVDLVLGWFDQLPERINRQALLTEEEALVVRSGHPLVGSAPTREQLLAQRFVVVELTGAGHPGAAGFIDDRGVVRRTWVERLLLEEGRLDPGHSHVAVTVPSYAEVAPVLRLTDLVATLPRRFAERAARTEGLAILDLPYLPLSVPVEMIWHDRAVGDPGLRWLMAQTEAAAQTLSCA